MWHSNPITHHGIILSMICSGTGQIWHLTPDLRRVVTPAKLGDCSKYGMCRSNGTHTFATAHVPSRRHTYRQGYTIGKLAIE